MRSLKAMSLLIYVYAIVSVEMTLGEEDIVSSVLQAIMESYDIDKNFRDNFFTILHIVCPNSVQCDTWDTSENHSSYLDGFLNDTYYLSNELFPNKNTSLMNEARAYLREVFKNMTDCCKQCYCLEQCRGKNCCPLNVAEDKTEKIMPVTIKQECIVPSIYTKVGNDKGIYMVTDCLNTSVDGELLRKCKYPYKDVEDEMIPVYSNLTDLIYKNKYCALCNNEIRVILWERKVSFSGMFTIMENTQFPNTSHALFQAAQTAFKLVRLSLVFPDELIERQEEFKCFPPNYRKYKSCVEDILVNEQEKYFFHHACSYFESPYRLSNRNALCYICSGMSDYGNNEKKCGRTGAKFTIKSFTAVLVTRNQTSADVLTPEGSLCTCKEYYDGKTQMCRHVICPPWKNYHLCSCESFLKRIYGLMVRISLELSPETLNKPFIDLLSGTQQNIMVSKIQSGINKVFRKFWGPMEIEHKLMYRKSSISDPHRFTLHVLVFIRSKRVMENMPLLETIYKSLRSGVKVIVLHTPMVIALGKIIEDADVHRFHIKANYTSTDGKHLSRLHIYSSTASGMDIFQNLNKLLFCRRVTLNDEEMSLLLNYTLKAGYNVDDLSYIFEVTKQQMCLDDFINIFVNSAERRYISCRTNTIVVLGVTYLLIHVHAML